MWVLLTSKKLSWTNAIRKWYYIPFSPELADRNVILQDLSTTYLFSNGNRTKMMHMPFLHHIQQRKLSVPYIYYILYTPVAAGSKKIMY